MAKASKKTTAKKASAKKTAAKKTAKKTAKKAAKKKAAPKKTAAKKPTKKAAAKSESVAAKQKRVTTQAVEKVIAKKNAKKRGSERDDHDYEEEDRPIRVDKPCPFKPAALQEWRELLIQRYAEVSGDIQDLLHDAMDSEDGHTMPTHQADRGSDVDLQDISLGMLDDEETLLWQIERALHKIDTGSPIAFGLCEHTHEAIPVSRLKLLPWTPLSIQGADYMERHNLTLYDMILDE